MAIYPAFFILSNDNSEDTYLSKWLTSRCTAVTENLYIFSVFFSVKNIF